MLSTFHSFKEKNNLVLSLNTLALKLELYAILLIMINPYSIEIYDSSTTNIEKIKILNLMILVIHKWKNY